MSKQLVILDHAADQAVCCPPISEESLDTEQAVDMARMFKALGDPIRLRLLSRITSAAGGEICVCDITGDDFNVTGPTISHHLKTLRDAGLVEGERRGTWVYYRPVTANLRQLSALLAAHDNQGR
ncbi:MAG TPA: metalloregulator ArsR/SmtB family transcription factor [Micromonosporaceae bacterium]